MWLALDADGVLQVGAEVKVPPALVNGERLPIDELEELYLTKPGFSSAIRAWCGSIGAPHLAETVLARHCSVIVDPEVIAEVDAYRDHFDGIVLATNQVQERLDAMLKVYRDGFFDLIVASCAVGVAKPQSEYFEELCRAIGVSPSSVVFVDDRGANVEAARGLGLTAKVFRRLGGGTEMSHILRSLDL